MKKLFITFMAFVLVMSITACGSTTQPSNDISSKFLSYRKEMFFEILLLRGIPVYTNY